MTIAITSSGISLDGPLVAGEKVAVTVSGLALAAEDKPTLALLARFPDALLASVELAESETAGTWTGELDTATKQTALFFATARADERRDAALELVSGRVSLARLTVPMANSALCPKPDGSPFASPVYVPVPGPPGQGGDPYDQAPQMDGEASAGVSDEYARGDHRHPTDESRMAATATGVDIKAGGDVGNISITAALTQLDEDLGGKQDTIADLAAIRSGAEAGATAVQPADLATVATTGNYEDLTNKPTIPSASDFVAKTGDQQIKGDLTVSRAGGAPPSDYVMVGNTMGSNATSFIAVNNDGNQLAMSVGVGNDPAIITQKGDLFGAALTPANFGTLALQEGIAPAFSTSSTYAVGDYCTHEGLLYKCTTAVSTAGAWNEAKWTEVAATTQFVPWANAAKNAVTIGTRSGVVGEYSVAQGINVTATGARSRAEGDSTTATEGNAHAEGYSTSATGISSHAEGRETTAAGAIAHSEGLSTYAAGRPSHSEGSETTAAGIASHADGYRAVTAASGNGSGATTPHDYAYAWQGVSTGGYYRSHGAGTFNINPVGGAAGFYIGEDSLASLFRYAFASPTPTVSGTSATVACEDRAINNFTVATGITSLTITPPAAVSGRARDFFCRVTLTDSSLPTVTLTDATIDIGATEIAGMTQGVNLLMFTEIASGHWLASRRSAS